MADCKGSMTVKTGANKNIVLEYDDSPSPQIVNKNGWKDFFDISTDAKYKHCAVSRCYLKDKLCTGDFKIVNKKGKKKRITKAELTAPF